MKGHNHRYYDKAEKINGQLCDYLKKHELADGPQYELYDFKR